MGIALLPTGLVRLAIWPPVTIGIGPSWADYDNDGDMDVFITSWQTPRLADLYRNNGDGTFSLVSASAGVINEAYRGMAWGDYDNDGDLDLFAARGYNTNNNNPGQTNRLYRNNGNSTFTEVGVSAGVAQSRNSQHAMWADFNNDGYLDLFVINAGDVHTGNKPDFLAIVEAGEPEGDPTPTPPPPVILYLSLANNGPYTVGAVAGVRDEDILSFDGSNFAIYFDGSDVGLQALDLDAFYIVDSTILLVSFQEAATIGNLGLVDDSDILQFNATSLGPNTTGTFSLFFDGSDVELTTDGEDIDAIEILADGRLLISTVAGVSVPGVSAVDEDLLAFTPASLGNNTGGT